VSVELRAGPLDVAEAMQMVRHRGAGALVVFVGVVRDRNEGRAVRRLDYEAYEGMARAEMGRVLAEVAAEHPGVRLAALHRVGALAVGETAVVCAASAPHREEAFTACRACIDGIKQRAPIWKREHGPGGGVWVGWDGAPAAEPTVTRSRSSDCPPRAATRPCRRACRRRPPDR
jgi:molybdopterin synthase catalytic subunit